MALINPKSYVESRDSDLMGKKIRIQRQRFEWIMALSAEIDKKFGCMGALANNLN